MFAFNDASSDVPLKTPVKLPEFLPYAIPLVEPVVFGLWPNITGSNTKRLIGDSENQTGAFKFWTSGSALISGGSGSVQNQMFDFDASRSSALYNGSKLQALALQCLACIRT